MSNADYPGKSEQEPGYPPPGSPPPWAQPAWPGQPPGSWGSGPGIPPPLARFCFACGTPLVLTAAICPRCGTAVGSPRSKGVAVALAVFFSFFTWLYTYRQDRRKFWVAVWLLAAEFLLSVLAVAADAPGLLVADTLISLGVWIWAIVSTIAKPEADYRSYPGPSGGVVA